MSFPPRFLDDLRNALTLSEIVGGRVRLTRSNREFKGCCPFHQEKTPSFYVNDDKQFFHCFGCGAHGDVLGFTMRADNLSFVETVEALAVKAGLEVPRSSPETVRKAKVEKSLFSLTEEACRWFESKLVESRNTEVMEYLTSRGLNRETIASFRLGYAPASFRDLRQYLKARGYDDAAMIEASLLKPGRDGREPYDFFRDRVMFPVADIRGRIVAFSGRVLPAHIRPLQDQSKAPPKYINSTDTPLFHKGRMLYAQQHARLAATDHAIVVVEGQLDVIASHQAGFKGAVAPLGTALTDDQITAVWRMIPDERKIPILCFDGDNAGYKAAQRAALRLLPLLKPDHSARFCFLPEGEDPDSFIKSQGAEGFSKLLDNALSLLDFLWTNQTSGVRYDTPETKAGLSASCDQLAARIQDSGVQYHYKSGFRDRIREKFSASSPAKPWIDNGKKASAEAGMRLPPLRKQVSRIPHIVTAALLNHPFLHDEFSERFVHLEIEDVEIANFLHGLLDFISASDGVVASADLMEYVHRNGFSDTAARLLHEKTYTHAGFSRAGTKQEAVLEGIRTLLEDWEKSRMADDFEDARRAFRADMSHENETRILSLRRLKIEEESGNNG